MRLLGTLLVLGVALAHAAPLAWPPLWYNPYVLDANARKLVATAASRQGLVDLLTTESALLQPYGVTIPPEFTTPAGANLLADAIIANLQLYQYTASASTRFTFWSNNITNTFVHGRYLTNSTTTSGGGPNHDTIYSSSFIDLSNGPVVFSLPPSHEIHYFSALFTDIFGDITYKVISTGPGVSNGGNWVFVQKGYELSHDEQQRIGKLKATVVDWPYNIAGVILRTFVSSLDQYPSIWAFQDSLSLSLLSGKAFVKPSSVAGVTPDLNRAFHVLKNFTEEQYPAFLGRLILAFQDNPPVNLNQQSTDTVGNALARFNIDSALPFVYTRLSAQQVAALWHGFQLAVRLVQLAEVQSYEYLYPNVRYTLRATQGTNELLQAAINADFNYAGNLVQDTLYGWVYVDTDGQLLDASNTSYVITVNPEDYYKPSTGFWSLTLYDSQLQLIANPINRYSISDRSAWQGPGTPLRINNDSSITVYVSATRPDPSVQPWYDNWLPAPRGGLVLLFRFYDPTPKAIDGTFAGWPLSKAPAPAPAPAPASHKLRQLMAHKQARFE